LESTKAPIKSAKPKVEEPFNLKDWLVKIIAYWWLILICLVIALG